MRDFGHADMFINRRNSFDRCAYYLKKPIVDEDNKPILNQLEFDDFPNGWFDAKLVSGILDNKNVVGGSFMFSYRNLTIKTRDDVWELKANDKVEFRGIMYNVESCNKTPLRLNNEFTDQLEYAYVITLRG